MLALVRGIRRGNAPAQQPELLARLSEAASRSPPCSPAPPRWREWKIPTHPGPARSAASRTRAASEIRFRILPKKKFT
jgi:hypothetical protein